MSKVVIVGSGPAGVSAALYTARAGVETTVLTKGPGTLERAERIENYYGFAEPVTGAELGPPGHRGCQSRGCAVCSGRGGGHPPIPTDLLWRRWTVSGPQMR